MIAESLVRILNKRRDAAVKLGTFQLPVLGRTSTPVNVDAHLPVHDSVLAPLLARAVECRVYVVSPQSTFFGLLQLWG